MIRRFTRELLGVDRTDAASPRWVIILAVFVVATVVALFRVPAESWNVLWAEDGPVFVSGAYADGFFAIAHAYNGYLHLVPRTLAALTVSTTPVLWVPLVLAVLAAITVGLVAAAVFVFAKTRLRSTVLCALIALQVVVLPIAGGEVALSIANLHWYLIFGAFWAAVVTPRSRWLTVVQCVLVASAILSDPLAALLVFPLVLARLVGVRPWRGRQHAVSWTFVAASVVQAVATLIATFVFDQRSGSSTLPGVGELTEVYTGRVVLSSLVGVTGTNTLATAFGFWALLLATIVAAVIIGVAAWRDASRRWLVLVFAAASIGFAVVAVVLKWDGLAGIPVGALAPGGRYFVVPVLLLFSAYVIAADAYADLLTPRRLGWLPVAAIAAIVVVPGAIDYRLADVRAEAPPWSESLEVATAACLADPAAVSAPATIAPVWFPGATIPCTVLVAQRSN